MKIDWTKKLTSRKFWVSVTSFVSMLIVALGGAQSTATQITALIMAGASVIAYVIGEGITDAAQASSNITLEGEPLILEASVEDTDKVSE